MRSGKRYRTFSSSSLFICLKGSVCGGSNRILADILMWRTFNLITIKSYLIKKNWTPLKCWAVYLHGISESYSLMIVFFEKAMITGLPLQNKMRTYKKRRKKRTSELLFSQSGLDSPPPQLPNPTKISWLRAWIYVIVVVEKRYLS